MDAENSTITIADDDYDCKCEEHESWTYGIYVDPEERRVSHYAHYGNGTPAPVWHNRATIIKLPKNAVGRCVLERLKRDEVQELLERLCDTYQGSKWDGSNHVGKWDDENAAPVEYELDDWFSDVPRYCSISDFFHDPKGEAENIRRQLKEGKTLKEIAEEIVEGAELNNFYLDDIDVEASLAWYLEYPAEDEDDEDGDDDDEDEE